MAFVKATRVFVDSVGNRFPLAIANENGDSSGDTGVNDSVHVLVNTLGEIIDPATTQPYIVTPLGYQQITNLSSPIGLTVPIGATIALISVEGAPIRYRDDTVNPTATIGMPKWILEEFEYYGPLSSLRIIQQSPGAIVNVLYYK